MGIIISTHAPAGGATCFYPDEAGRIDTISTHAPAGGATRSSRTGGGRRTNFYSRPCGRGDFMTRSALWKVHEFLLTPLREGRQNRAIQSPAATAISTHAPAGGATGLFNMAGIPTIISTHAPAGGATIAPILQVIGQILFLLTPLREGRLRHVGNDDQSVLYFYSRPCGRGDLCGGHASGGHHAISTHAPAGGATLAAHDALIAGGLFLLTPLREGRRGRDDGVHIAANFYSRPCGRGDTSTVILSG